MLFYVFDIEAEAIAAADEIARIGHAPVPGRGVNGQYNGGQETIGWAIPWQRVTDGKWVFPKVPAEMIVDAGQEAEDAFNAAFTYVFEEYSPDWRPEVDGE